MAAAAIKAPVAGQKGYKPETENKASAETEPRQPANIDELQKEGELRELKNVEPKAVAAPQNPSGLGTREGKAIELLDYLIGSGTNPKKLADDRAFYSDRPEATALEAFRYLESAEERGDVATSPGTLRKAGKWLWGNAWELESAVLQAPAEEIKNLREKVAVMEGQMIGKNNEVASLRSQIAFLQETNGNLARQVDFLKAGRTTEELRSIGIGQ